MDWKTIRLELARTERFPKGSASRAFLLRVPLDEDGMINVEAVEQHPAHAVVRRFWSSEPDQSGRIERSDGKWVLRCGRPQSEETTFRLASVPLNLNGEVIVEGVDGTPLPFRVASIRDLGSADAGR